MGAAVELKQEPNDPNCGKAQPEWTAPVAAYTRYRPGLSPYMHYWQQLRARRGQTAPPPDHQPEDGAKLPGQMAEALEDLIHRSFGE